MSAQQQSKQQSQQPAQQQAAPPAKTPEEVAQIRWETTQTNLRQIIMRHNPVPENQARFGALWAIKREYRGLTVEAVNINSGVITPFAVLVPEHLNEDAANKLVAWYDSVKKGRSDKPTDKAAG